MVIASLIVGIIGLFLIAIIPPLFEGNLVVDTYDAALYANGTLTERYTYDVKTSGEYRMLFRSWNAPLTFGTAAGQNVQFVSVNPPSGTIGYAKDVGGNVIVTDGPESSAFQSTITTLAETNEVGIFNPDYYSDGKYTVEYSYILHPPLEYDSTTSHLNLKFAGGSHIPYRTIRITIPAKNVEQVYVYPPFMVVRNDGDTYTITGSAAADENVAVELLATADGLSAIPGIRTEVADLKSKTASGSFWYNLPYFVASLLNILAKACVILVPILLITLYYHYGREKMFTVPEYLSTIPNPSLKPWQVNLLFKDDALDFDEDGYYATLLELHRRKLIHITEKGTGKGIEIQILSTATSDPYELRVLAFIQQLSENNVLDTDKIEALAKKAQSNRTAEEKALQYQRMLADVTSRADAALPAQYIVDGREHMIPLLLITIVLFAITLIFAFVTTMQSYILIPAVILWAAVLVQVIIAIAAPSTLFGHWKDDKYKEKLEWDAFSHFLSDLTMIQKYAPSDISMWGAWLVYGTALGVGENVEKAMKSLNIRVNDTGVPLGVIGMNYAFLPLLHFTPPSHGGSGGGGGFGGGGGLSLIHI